MSQAARELFRRAEPLLRLKRKGGWSSDEAWATLVEHWLLDVGEQISTPMPKRRQLDGSYARSRSADGVSRHQTSST